MKKEIMYKILIAIAIVAVGIVWQYIAESTGFIQSYWRLFGLDYMAAVKYVYGSYFRIALASVVMTVSLCIGTHFIYDCFCKD